MTPSSGNDTGVFEGGEISMHYDPMIAVVRRRRIALARSRPWAARWTISEVEGIGQSAVSSAVMDQQRLPLGDLASDQRLHRRGISDGFSGVTAGERQCWLAAVATFIHSPWFLEAARRRLACSPTIHAASKCRLGGDGGRS